MLIDLRASADGVRGRCSLDDLDALFPDDEACLERLWRTRFAPDGELARCPHCQETRRFRRSSGKARRHAWSCTSCGHYLYPTASTIFHKSSTSLRLWFYAIYLIKATNFGITAKQLERELGVTYKTAWRMQSLICNQLLSQSDEDADAIPASRALTL